MRLLFLLALLAFFFSLSFAQSAAENATNVYIYPNEAHVLEEFTHNNTAYVAVKLGGEYALLFENANGNYSLITDKPRIYSVLMGLKVSQLGLENRVNAVRESLLAFNNSREPKEKLCRQYTGLILTDGAGNVMVERPCHYDASNPQPVESCLVACRASFLCLTALANNIEPIYEILHFKDSLSELNANMAELLGNLERMKLLDQQAADKAIENLDSVDKTKAKIAKNQLFTAYGFCHPINFNNSALSDASAALAVLNSDFDYIAGIESVVAERVAKFGKERATLVESEAYYKIILSNATVWRTRVRATVNSALGLVDDPATRNALDSAEKAYSALGSAINAKDYRAADVAYPGFIVAAENAEYAASTLEGQFYGTESRLANCTQTLASMKSMDTAGQYAGNRSSLLGRLGTVEGGLNQTPLSSAEFVSLQTNLLAACTDTGSLLMVLGTGMFDDKLALINQNLAKARNISESAGQIFNSTSVTEILDRASATMQMGDLGTAASLYGDALRASEQLIAASQKRMDDVNAALAAIEDAEYTAKSTEGSPLFLILRPDTSAAHKLITQAKVLAYSDPAKARELAANATNALKPAADTINTGNYILFGVLLWAFVLFAGLLLLVVFIWRRRHRQKQGIQAGQQQIQTPSSAPQARPPAAPPRAPAVPAHPPAAPPRPPVEKQKQPRSGRKQAQL